MIGKFGPFEYPLAHRYTFDAELGRGAMGCVYRATDLRLGRAVAIKVLHATLANDAGVRRFQSEIRIAAGLHHPNIVSVHDSGEVDGRLFYVMDYLAGETLRDRLAREKQLPIDDALSIVDQVSLGLQFAHDLGIVHRDIKPENILLVDGDVKIVDFGLARAVVDSDERLTATGLSVGTPQYLSPEQASAEKVVGPKCDQYALGCVLYEMLVGEPPFTGPTATAVAMRHIVDAPVPPRSRRRTTPAAIDAAVMRALEKIPADSESDFGSNQDHQVHGRWKPLGYWRELRLCLGVEQKHYLQLRKGLYLPNERQFGNPYVLLYSLDNTRLHTTHHEMGFYTNSQGGGEGLKISMPWTGGNLSTTVVLSATAMRQQSLFPHKTFIQVEAGLGMPTNLQWLLCSVPTPQRA